MIEKLMKTVVLALDDKLAQNIEVIDVSEITDLGDYFVIATGNSSTQVRALADAAEEKALKPALEHAAKAAEDVLAHGVPHAANLYNRKA